MRTLMALLLIAGCGGSEEEADVQAALRPVGKYSGTEGMMEVEHPPPSPSRSDRGVPLDGLACALERTAPVPPETSNTRLEVPHAVDDWLTDADQVEQVTVDGTRGLRYRCEGTFTVVLRGQYEPGDFSLIGVDVSTSSAVQVRTGLRRSKDGTGWLQGPNRMAPGERSWFGDSHAALSVCGEGFDLLLLRFEPLVEGQPLDLCVFHVDLVNRPLERWLPVVGVDEPGPIDLGNEVRDGYGLVMGAPVRAPLDVPQLKDQEVASLRFGFGRSGTPVPNQADLVVRIDGEEVHRVSPPRAWREFEWWNAEIDLSTYAGQEVDLEIELVGKGHAALISLEQPIVLVGSSK